MLTIETLEHKICGRTPVVQGGAGSYAVLAALVERDGELHFLFEVRAESLHRQPGEICFPGGRMEAGETAVQCALRETEEELGIPAEEIRVIGPLDFIHQEGGAIIYPILGCIKPEAAAQASPGKAEVREIFFVPLSFFENNEPLLYTYKLVPKVEEDFPYDLIGFDGSYPWRQGRAEVPIYVYGQRVIWGLTARMVKWLIDYMKET